MNDISKGIIILLKKLIGKWYIYLILLIIGFSIGYGIFSIQKNKYYSSSTFIVEEKSAGGLGGLSSLASSFGIDIAGSAGGGGIYAGDNILDILKSKLVIKKVLLSKVTDKQNKEVSLADIYYNVKKFNQIWKNKPYLNNLQFYKESSNIQEQLLKDSAINLFIKIIIKNELNVSRVNKKGSIILVEFNFEDDIFAKYFVERIISETKNLYIDIKTKTVQTNINRLERQADTLLKKLNYKSYQVASENIFNVNAAYKEALLPSEFSQREKQIAATIYSEVIKNLETSKLSLSQLMPLIQIIDNVEFPLENKKHGKWYFIAITVFILFLFYTLILFIQYLKENAIIEKFLKE